ncbi:MAG TPA: carboxylating nicotinate-nucleotide diphosphorylase [Chitinophagaceae bacterium]|nr:carboxylating nicotinate-nucleotide diphosphorylase [Chitinophagaceae bacterium]
MIAGEKMRSFIKAALKEDIGSGDHSTLACIPSDAAGKAVLKIKSEGILAGVVVAQQIFEYLEPGIRFNILKKDGAEMQPGEMAFEVEGKAQTLLKGERLVLNCMQRMSGIATLTKQFTNKIKAYPTRLLDTRKTSPNFRLLEKEAVLIGGGYNHRMGLYDMIMLKDNHIDFAGGIAPAIARVQDYLREKGLDIPVEVEARGMKEVHEILEAGNVQRIMLDNFTPEETRQAVALIGGAYETEASGGITLDKIAAYANAGVDFVSAGAVIHQAVSLDLSLKAEI